jgi:hypothetical protein
MKERKTPVNQIDHNLQEAEKIKKACKARRSGVQRNLVALYELLEEEIPEEEDVSDVRFPVN